MPRIWVQNENMLIPYYLMFSYLYYEKNISLIDDAEFYTFGQTQYLQSKKYSLHNKDMRTLNNMVSTY